MHVLLVNNDSDSWDQLQRIVMAAGWKCSTVHNTKVGMINELEYDLVILSGGWWYDDPVKLLERYAAELAFIATTRVPVLGICIGMQLMHVALDQAVPLMDAPEQGFRTIHLTHRGRELFGLPERIPVFKNHTRAIVEADPSFEVLARSPGHVEIMLHVSRPMLGVQFHPESDEDEQRGVQLLKTLANTVVKHPSMIVDTK